VSAAGFASGPTAGAYCAPPDPLAGFKGVASLQEGNGGRTRGGEERGTGRNGEGRENGKLGVSALLVGG